MVFSLISIYYIHIKKQLNQYNRQHFVQKYRILKALKSIFYITDQNWTIYIYI